MAAKMKAADRKKAMATFLQEYARIGLMRPAAAAHGIELMERSPPQPEGKRQADEAGQVIEVTDEVAAILADVMGSEEEAEADDA